MLTITANESTAAQRRVTFHCVDETDGITAELGEAGGQPQVSVNGSPWQDTGIGVLVAIGNGRYYADLTQAIVGTPGDILSTRYKSANTAEAPGDSVQVVSYDPVVSATVVPATSIPETQYSTDPVGRLAAVRAAIGKTLNAQEWQNSNTNGSRGRRLMMARLKELRDLEKDLIQEVEDSLNGSMASVSQSTLVT